MLLKIVVCHLKMSFLANNNRLVDQESGISETTTHFTLIQLKVYYGCNFPVTVDQYSGDSESLLEIA